MSQSVDGGRSYVADHAASSSHALPMCSRKTAKVPGWPNVGGARELDRQAMVPLLVPARGDREKPRMFRTDR